MVNLNELDIDKKKNFKGRALTMLLEICTRKIITRLLTL